MLDTIQFFEHKGLQRLKKEDQEGGWYDDFIRFLGENNVLATLFTPAGYGDENSRYDLTRISEYSELLSFYSGAYQVALQFTLLGTGPIWMGENEELKLRTAKVLKRGGLLGFGVSEKERGSDVFSCDMALAPQSDGDFLANGGKYYIGNGNAAALVSTFGKLTDTGEHVFFVVNPELTPNYTLVKKIGTMGICQAFVAQYDLKDYPITKADIISRGKPARAAVMNTINMGKFALGFVSIGSCQHAFYEAINHASQRVLFGQRVTDFIHLRKLLTESYARLVSMRLYGYRCRDYYRAASDDDRRYLLYGSVLKNRVTTMAARVADMLLDVIAAKGFEVERRFEMSLRDLPMVPRLEGTVHVNMAVVAKLMRNFLFDPGTFAPVARMDQPGDDAYMFKQKLGGMVTIQFPDIRAAFESAPGTNAAIFQEQVALLIDYLTQSPPSMEQLADLSYLFELVELVTTVAYANVAYEGCLQNEVDPDLVEEIFRFLVKDFSGYALALLQGHTSTPDQESTLRKMLIKPALDAARFNRVWEGHVAVQADQYSMKP